MLQPSICLSGHYTVYILIKLVQRGTGPFIRSTLALIGVILPWTSLEEISYGQHFFSFKSPDWFIEHNYNMEINLHNLGQDQLSHFLRTGGYLTVALSGIIAPLIVHFSGIKFAVTNWFYYFLPTPWLIVPSLFHLFASLPKKILKFMPDWNNFYFSQSGEYEEYMLGVWVILFLSMVHRVIRNRSAFDNS